MFICRHHRVVKADREQRDLVALLLLLESRGYLILDPTALDLLIDCSDRISSSLSRSRAALSISSSIMPPIGKSCGANRQRTVDAISEALILGRITNEVGVILDSLIGERGQMIDQIFW